MTDNEMNTDFDIDTEAAPQEIPEVSSQEEPKAAPQETPKKKAPAKKKAAPAKKSRRSGWPIIFIDEEEGRPNYELVGVNGKEYRIMRGVDVPVPHEVVEVLKNAVSTHYTQTVDPVTRNMKLKRTDRAAVPWRIVGYEK